MEQLFTKLLLAFALVAAPVISGAQEKANGSDQGDGAQAKEFRPMVMPADLLVGMEVQNPAGDLLGTVEDLLIDPKTDRVTYIITTYRNEAAMRGVYFAIPWSAMAMGDPDERTLVFEMYEQMYGEGDRFQFAGADMIAEYQGKIYIFYGREPEAAGGADYQTVGAGFHAAQTSALAEMKQRTVNLSKLNGATVANAQNDTLGTLADVMLDMNHGHVVYATIQPPESNQYAVVPWATLDIGTDPSTVTLRMEPDQLKKQAVNPADLPNLADMQRASQLHETYGTTPYWKKYNLQ